jgi:hypothetical protein
MRSSTCPRLCGIGELSPGHAHYGLGEDVNGVFSLVWRRVMFIGYISLL